MIKILKIFGKHPETVEPHVGRVAGHDNSEQPSQIVDGAPSPTTDASATDTARSGVQQPVNGASGDVIAGNAATQLAMSEQSSSNGSVTARHSAPSPDMSGYLTLDDVMIEFERAGVSRARRTFQRYCETGLLEAVKFDTTNNVQYFVVPSSVPRAIESVKAMSIGKKSPDMVGQSVTAPAVSGENVGTQRAPSAATLSDADAAMRYLERLEHDLDRAENEIDIKNTQIATLMERNRETNALFLNVQKILLPLMPGAKGIDPLEIDKTKGKDTKSDDVAPMS